MATSPVLPNGGQPPTTGSASVGGKGKDEAASLREELATLRKTNSELQSSEAYWKGVADAGKRPEPEPEPDEDDEIEPDSDELEDDTPEKLVDDFSASGIKALQKRGLLTRKEAVELAEKIAGKIVRTELGKARAEMTQDQALLGEFPELKDDKSPLFAETAKQFKALVKLDPSMKNSQGALVAAARLAKASLKPAPAVDAEGDDDDDLEDVDPRERRRLERVAAQSGDRGRRRTSDDGGDPDGAAVLGPQTRQLLAAMKITPEEYEKSRKAHPVDGRRR